MLPLSLPFLLFSLSSPFSLRASTQGAASAHQSRVEIVPWRGETQSAEIWCINMCALLKKKKKRERERKKKKTAAETWRREWCQIPPFSLRLGRGGGGVLRGWRKRGENKRQQLRKRLGWGGGEMKMWRERTSAPGDKNKAQGVSKW